jgi:hypothetical protein
MIALIASTVILARQRSQIPREPLDRSARHGKRNSKPTVNPAPRRSTDRFFAPTLPPDRGAEHPCWLWCTADAG